MTLLGVGQFNSGDMGQFSTGADSWSQFVPASASRLPRLNCDRVEVLEVLTWSLDLLAEAIVKIEARGGRILEVQAPGRNGLWLE